MLRGPSLALSFTPIGAAEVLRGPFAAAWIALGDAAEVLRDATELLRDVVEVLRDAAEPF